ncbi:MAG: UvrD-helicase domain-containing protein [Treponema sp.]|jgi:ATP-dependent helicase/nuclease subunit A|nr:UvrD-helicase domain-containing protein [Treponema sp.]
MSLQNLLGALDNEQKTAVTLETNGVVSAGAGSGKTKVLASRYAWLVMEKKLKPDEILTLTFTNKAVSEMYSRIHRYLLDQAEQNSAGAESENEAGKALKDFHKARISTLDSFSSSIARTAATRYGISPEFTSDETALRDIAGEVALYFVLDNREAPAIRQLLVDHKIRKLAEEIFAEVVLRYSPISSPLELDAQISKQKKAILDVWQEKTKLAEEITGNIVDALHTLAAINKRIIFTKTLSDILLESPPPMLPDISPLLETSVFAADSGWDAELPPAGIRQQIKKYFNYYSAVIAARTPGNYGEVYTPVVEYFRLLKGRDGNGLYQELESLANYAFNFGLCMGIFELIKKFQDEFNNKKRETGFLSFNDTAHLAVDALRDHPDIRKAYKDSLKMIMIDEFQDNNALQRNLIYLLAENPERLEKSIAPASELEKNRMFFVGDEKQSIYRFRGADVSVFRSLGKDLFKLQADSNIELIHNYRSRPGLIAMFNCIFGGLEPDSIKSKKSKGVFPAPGPDVPDYEAVYSRISPPENSCEGEQEPLAHFCFLNGEELPKDDTEGLKSQDLEAAFIAKKIRDMVTNKEKIPRRTNDGTEWAECSWGDFAVLERSYAHQSSLEKSFREFGVPYNTDRPSGLFNEAPVLDLRAYLRLLVYPEDRIAYAALIRSPFMRLSDLTLAVCMLSKETEPFAEENETFIPEDELELYRNAREHYRSLREAGRSLPITELITKLWFEEGYRHETLWSESAQVYEGLYDLFFSLASDADARGKSLADFIEYIDAVMNMEEKPDDKDIPGEGEPGVRIMSIHKSKGLEFPIVFIFDCAHSGNIRASSGLVNYHEKYGIILNIPQAEELPLGGNYFRNILLEEEKAKDIAELKRLLYVAMTRAECRLFLTFTLPKQTKEEKKDWDLEGKEFTEETICQRLIQLDQKSENSRSTFLKLLAGILPNCPASLCSLENIPVLSRAEISELAAYGENRLASKEPTQREAAVAAAFAYEKAKVLPEGKAGPVSIDASKLKYKLQSPEGIKKAAGNSAEIKNHVLDSLLEKTGLGGSGFGTLVHTVLEGRLNNREYFIPPVIRSRLDDEKKSEVIIKEAELMADKFFSSALGKRWASSSCRESEFPVITSVNNIEGKAVAIMGQIDLLFEEDDEVVVVDFKTDRIESPEDHYGQLAAYYQAVADIFGKPASVWLYYLRSGSAVNVTEEVQNISPEKLAADFMTELLL